MKDSDLAILAGKVAVAMEGNTYFSPDIQPSAAAILAAVTDYRAKHEVAINGGSKYERDLKKESKQALLYLLTHLAHSVNVEANGNVVALSSTGLLFNKQHTGLVEPGTTLRVLVRDGRISGQMRVDFDKIPDVFEYEIQVGQVMEGETEIRWGTVYTTTSSSGTVIAPLTPGVRYYVRVRGRNRIGAGNWSDVASLLVR